MSRPGLASVLRQLIILSPPSVAGIPPSTSAAEIGACPRVQSTTVSEQIPMSYIWLQKNNLS